MAEFKIKEWMRCENPEMNAYAREFEAYVTNLDAMNIKRMIVSIDNVAARIADDLDLLMSDEDTDTIRYNLKVMSDDKDSKVFDRFLTLTKMIESFQKVSETAQSLRPEKEKYKDPNVKEVIVNRDGNVFEELQKKKMEERRVKKGE